jgi:hypothetical protein
MSELVEIVFGPDTKVLVKGDGENLAGLLAATRRREKFEFFPLETANGEDVWVAPDQVLYIKSDKT